MSGWSTSVPQNTTGVFLNHSNGHVSTEILSHNSPYQYQRRDSYYNDSSYHYTETYDSIDRTEHSFSHRYSLSPRSSIYDSNEYQRHHTYNHDSLPRVHNSNMNTLQHPHHHSNGHVTWGTRPSLRDEPIPGMPPRNSNTSFFDMLAKSQLQRSNSARGNGGRKGSKTGSGLAGTLEVLRQSANSTHNNKVKRSSLNVYYIFKLYR